MPHLVFRDTNRSDDQRQMRVAFLGLTGHSRRGRLVGFGLTIGQERTTNCLSRTAIVPRVWGNTANPRRRTRIPYLDVLS
ncbi:hypothetical protein LZ30DRAFT_700744 [Colletotrichum cereale]|nr:hypothetical protein LZ30DRAFT_700744 [Colletotrichum cereale]